MKTKNKIIVTIILMLLILFIKTESKADNIKEGEEVNTSIEFITKAGTIKENESVEIEVHIKNDKQKLGSIDFLIDYNEDIFNKLKSSDIITDEDNYSCSYEENNKYVILTIKEGKSVNEAKICTIKLTPKKTINFTDEIQLFKIYDIGVARADGYIDYIEQVSWGRLYLASEPYKIGDNDINNYEDGDKYISRVVKETTKEKFVKNLKTNGKIRILKPDGTELKEDELVGTGMTLEVTKDKEKIELKIAVMGDLSGDGLVTAQDLSTIQGVFLEVVTLKDEFFVAADFEEINEMKISYMSEINQMCLL